MAVQELFPYLHVRGAAEAIRFYVGVFGATETLRLTEPGGRVGHAQLDFGGTTLMLSDEFPEIGVRAPQAGAPATVSIHVHVDNADAVIDRAVRAGATLEMAARDHFYGERSGVIRDPFGHRWNIGHHIEDVSAAEMQRRYDEMINGKG